MILTKILFDLIVKKIFTAFLAVIIVLVLFFNNSFSQSAGDFRSINSGVWSNSGIWQQYNGTTWIAAGSSPTSTAGIININSGHSIDLNGNFTLNDLIINSGATLNILAGDSLNIVHSNSADLTCNGTITGAGNIFLSPGSFSNIQGGTISGTGTFIVPATSFLLFNGSTATISRNISNSGTITWTSGNISGASTIDNNGVFQDSCALNYQWGMPITNNSTFNKYIAASSNTFISSFLNKGTVNVVGGTVSFNASSGTFNHTGNFNVSSGATLGFGSFSTATHNISSVISGAGNLLNSSKLKFQTTSTYNISGNSTFASDTANYPSGMTLTNIGNIISTGGVLNLNSGLVVGAYGSTCSVSGQGVLNFNTGTAFTFSSLTANAFIAGTDTLKVSNSFTAGSGVYTGAGPFILLSGCTSSINNTLITFDKNIVNSGTINWTSGALQGAGTITNNNIFNIQTVSGYSFSLMIINNGTINKTTVNNANSFNFTLTNSGTININIGSIQLNSPSGPTNHTGTFTVASGATLQFGLFGTTTTHNILSSITGAGNVIFSARIKFASTSTYNISGTSFFNGDSAIFNAGMTLTNIGTINNSGGILNLMPGVVIGGYGTNLTMNSGGYVILNTGTTTFTFSTVTSSANITGSDTVKITSTFTCGGGTYSGNGAMILQAGSSSSFTTGSFFINKNLFNFGTVTWNSGNLQGAGSITNNNIFNVQTTSGNSVSIIFINNGTMTKSSFNNENQFSLAFTNSGAIIINAGKISLIAGTGSNTHTGTWTVALGATLLLGNGGTLINNIQSSISGAGTVIFASIVNFTTSSTYNISGTTNIAGDTVNFPAGMNMINIGTITCTGGVGNFNSGLIVGAYNSSITVPAGVLNFNTGTAFNFSSLSTTGTISGTDTIKIASSFSFSGGLYTGSGPIVMQPGCSTLINQFNITCDKNIINNGTVLWTAGGIFGAGTFTNNSAFNIQTAFTYSEGLVLINNGTITKSVTNTRTNFNLGFTNSGTVTINTGIISIIVPTGTYNHTGNFNIASGALIEFGNGGTAVHNILSTINGAGNVSFIGNVNFPASSTFNVSGNCNFIAGVTNFNGGMTLTNLGTFSTTGGTANFNAGLTIAYYNPAITITGGGTLNFSTGNTITFTTITSDATLSGSDTIKVSSAFNFSNAVLSGSGPVVILSSATLAITNGSFVFSKTLINNGTINWNSGHLSGIGTIINNNIYNILPATNFNCGVITVNNGTINKTTSSLILFQSSLTNNNLINVTQGTFGVSTGSNIGTLVLSTNTILAVSGAYTSPGLINIGLSAVISGSGPLDYSYTSLPNNGTISVSVLKFSSNTTVTGTGAISSPTCTVFNGANVQLGTNHQFSFLTVNSGGTFSVSSYTLFLNGNSNPISNSGTFNTTGGIVEYNGISAQIIATVNMSYANLSINNAAGVTLNNKITIPGTVYFTSGNLTNSDTLVMGNFATINRKNGSVSGNLRFGSNTNVIYSGTTNITSGIELPAVVNQLTVNNAAGIILNNPITVNDTLSVLSGFLNLNGKIITLSSSGYLKETPGNTVRGSSGSLTTTRTINAPNNLNIGGLGVTFTSASSLGSTIITRSHVAQTVNGGNSILRYYDISPANNSALNCDLVFKYDNTEVNALNENALNLYKSTNSGTSWTLQGGTRDTVNNTISLSGVNSFSRWTAASNALATNLNITVIPEGLYNSGTNTLISKDSVTVYLALVGSPTAYIDSSKSIIDSVTFIAASQFNATPSGTYYIIVKHRNSLLTWSKTGGEAYTSGSTITYNFTIAATQAFGSNESLHNGKYTLIGGDINQDGFVNGNDFTQFSQQFGQIGYLRSDLNGDNVVNGNDFTIFSSGFGKQYQHP